MRELVLIANILFWSYLAQLFLPWWMIFIVCFIICYMMKPSKFIAFVASLLGVFILWTLKAYMADTNFDVPMSALLGALLGNLSGSLVFLLTGLIGGIVGGLGGLLGSWTQTLLSHQNKKI